MAFERPLIEKLNPTLSESTFLRGIVSPCVGCENNIPAPSTPDEAEALAEVPCALGHPCPKKVFYSIKKDVSNQRLMNFDHPVFDEELLPKNPVWPGESNGNPYAFLWVATYKDNKDTGFNTTWDTKYIHCRGPVLISLPERIWHIAGHLTQGDEVLIIKSKFGLDGIDFFGFAEEAQVWQSSLGYKREVDHNLGKSFSANGSI